MQAALNVIDNAIKHLKLIKPLVESDVFEKVVIELCHGRIWSIGMGKAAQPARKLASTLSCFGRPAAFIHPGEALHGDLGAIQAGDILVAFSNSGKTEEVLRVIERTQSIATIVLVTGTSVGVGTSADHVICFGQVEEACPLGLTPTTSTLVMMALADALAISVQVKLGLSYEEYAANHHAGYLGQIARERSIHKDIETAS